MKKRRITRWLALALAGVMLCTSAPVNAYAADTGTGETETAPFSVSFSNEYAKVGDELNAVVAGAEEANCKYTWLVDGKRINNTGSTYVPKQTDLQKLIAVEVSNGKENVKASIFCSELPVVYIDTENNVKITSKDYYVNANMKMQGNSQYKSKDMYTGAIEIRGRGNSTWSMPKKPYKIKLGKSTNILKMGKNKHWVLLANYSDGTLMRNTLSYNLSGKMGMPYMQSIWVDVVMNGEYAGNYQFCEQIKIAKDRVNIFDWEDYAEDVADAIAKAEGFKDSGELEDTMVENLSWITSGTFEFRSPTDNTLREYKISDYVEGEPDITGGYLLELDDYFDEVSIFRSSLDQPIMFKSPEFAATNNDMFNYVKKYIDGFESAVFSTDFYGMYDGKETHYSELFDMDSLIDFWLVNEVFYNSELNFKSTYMYKPVGEPMKMGPIWDMDWSSHGEGYTWYTDKWVTLERNQKAQGYMWYKFLVNDPSFILRAQERYWEIRPLLDDMIKEGGIIDQTYMMLKSSADANWAMWPYKYKSFQSEVNTLHTWLRQHIAWLDEQFATESSVIESIAKRYYNSSLLEASLTDAEGKVLGKDTSAKNPASYVTETGKAVKISVSAKNVGSDWKTATFYVNGLKAGTAPISNNSATFTITSDKLTAGAGKKDIITMKVEDRYTNYETAYVTVLEQDSESPTPAVTVESIEIASAPKKTSYLVGEKLSTDGLIVNAVYSDNTKTAVTNYEISGYDKTKSGKQTVTVTCSGKTATFTVTVNMKGDLTGDGKVDLVDFRMMLRAICGKAVLTDSQKHVGDLTGDGKVDLSDLRQMLRYICKKIDTL